MTAGNLPEDVTWDILSRVPVKSVLRFRCVHKSWNFLFKSSSFVTTHLKNFSNRDRSLLLLIQKDDDEHPKSRFKLLTNDNYDTFNFHSESEFEVPFSSVVGSSNGLVCLYNDYVRSETIILYNPSLKLHKIIPLHCDFNPIIICNYRVLGFGYDYINNDYKVVCWYSHRWTEVYSLGVNSWRKVKTPGNFTIFSCDHQNAFLNGAMHWLGRNEEEEKKCRNVVVSFNISSEVFQMIPHPNYEVQLINLKIEVYRDLLCLVSFGRTMNNDWYYDIWVQGKYGVQDSWMRLYTVDDDAPAHIPGYLRGYGYWRGFVWNGELFWKRANGVDYFDDGNSKTITFVDDGHLRFSTESLVSVE